MGPFPNIYILIAILLLTVFYLRQDDLKYRQYSLILASALFLLSVSMAVFLATILAAMFVRLVVPRIDLSKKGPYFICVAVSLIPVFINDFMEFASISEFIEFFGGGFLGIRTFLLLKSMSSKSVKYTLFDMLTYLFFFPIYLTGPIERPEELNEKIAESKWDLSRFVDGVTRFLIGLVKIYLVAAFLASVSQSLDIGTSSRLTEFWLFCVTNWFLLYFLFSGYTDIAIGTAALFGIPVRENFNYPFLSRSIQEYWQRWHITVMEVVSENVYRPFVRRTGRRAAGFFVSFTVMGVWHSVSPNFLIWGLIHATTFAIYFHYSRSRFFKNLRSRVVDQNVVWKYIWMMVSIFITITCVSVASAIGTTELLKILQVRLS